MIVNPSPTFRLPRSSVEVYTTLPPFSDTVSFSGIVIPPSLGSATPIVNPAPTYSNVYEDASIRDCLANGTVEPTPTFAGIV